MSEEILEPKAISTTTGFEAASNVKFASDDDDYPIEKIISNGRNTGRYARQGICIPVYGC